MGWCARPRQASGTSDAREWPIPTFDLIANVERHFPRITLTKHVIGKCGIELTNVKPDIIVVLLFLLCIPCDGEEDPRNSPPDFGFRAARAYYTTSLDWDFHSRIPKIRRPIFLSNPLWSKSRFKRRSPPGKCDRDAGHLWQRKTDHKQNTLSSAAMCPVTPQHAPHVIRECMQHPITPN